MEKLKAPLFPGPRGGEYKCLVHKKLRLVTYGTEEQYFFIR